MSKMQLYFCQKVFEPDEAQDKNLNSLPVQCNKCGSTNIKEY